MADTSHVAGAAGARGSPVASEPVLPGHVDTAEPAAPSGPDVAVDEWPRPVQRWSALDLARGAVGLAIAGARHPAGRHRHRHARRHAGRPRPLGRAPARPGPHRDHRARPGGCGRRPGGAGRGRGRHPPPADARRDRRRGPPRRGRHVAARARRRRPCPAGVVAGAGRARELDHRAGVPHLRLPGRGGGRRRGRRAVARAPLVTHPVGGGRPCWPSSGWCRARTCRSIWSWRSGWVWPAGRRHCSSWGLPTCPPPARPWRPHCGGSGWA